MPGPTHSIEVMGIRIFRNSAAKFYRGDEIESQSEVYTDAWFERLRENGFNGFWINAWMRSLVAFREPENDDRRRRTEELNRLIERASAFGVGLYLYLNEPHAFLADDPILKRFPDLAGEEEMWPVRDAKRYRMVCTSAQAGKDYVHECSRKMHEALPGIAGSIHINAAESPTHCYCHIITNPGGTIFASTIEHEGIKCPRCAQRTPEEVISEILNLFHAGARDAGSKANIIAWNWDWVMYAPDPQPRLIERLHPEIMVMAGFECGGKKQIYGKERRIEEYSLILPGPSPQFEQIDAYARETGHDSLAKLQLGTTHEAGSVSNMPLIANILEKIRWLRENKSAGYMGCWNFGDRFTMNTAASALAQSRPDLTDADTFCAELGRRYLGLKETEGFVRALKTIRRAFDAYPVANRMLHVGPVSFAPMYPLDDAPLTGVPLTGNYLDRERGDDWDECLGPYTWEEVIPGFERVAGTMEHGLADMDRALFPSANPWDTRLHSYRGASVIPDESDRMNEAERLKFSEERLPADVFESLPELRSIFGLRRLEEWCNGWGLCLIMRSVGHLFKNFYAKKTGVKNYADLLRDLQERELKTIERALPLFCLDGRLGKHLECSSYLVSREQLESKRLALREALGLGS